MTHLLLCLWAQWYAGSIGMLQTFQAVGDGQVSTQQRLSWGTGVAVGRTFGDGRWGMTAEVLSAFVQIGSRIKSPEELYENRTRISAAEAVLLAEHYWQLGSGWEFLVEGGAVLNIPYRLEYFAQHNSRQGEAFLFMEGRKYWEMTPNGNRFGTLRESPYPKSEVSVLTGVGLEKRITDHWSLVLEARLEYSPHPMELPVQRGELTELAGWHLPTRPPHLLAESLQLSVFYFFGHTPHHKESML